MRRVGIVIVVAFLSVSSFAQFRINTRGGQSRSNSSDSPSSFLDRFYFSGGGNFGSGTSGNGIGYRYSYFSLFPTVGYKVTPQFLVGLNYSYSKYNFPDQGFSYEQVGYAPFVRYYLQQLFFQAEYDWINTPTINYNNGGLETSKYYKRFLVGLGYRAMLGKRTAVNVVGMYDLLYQPNSGPFLSPFVYRVFFSY